MVARCAGAARQRRRAGAAGRVGARAAAARRRAPRGRRAGVAPGRRARGAGAPDRRRPARRAGLGPVRHRFAPGGAAGRRARRRLPRPHGARRRRPGPRTGAAGRAGVGARRPGGGRGDGGDAVGATTGRPAPRAAAGALHRRRLDGLPGAVRRPGRCRRPHGPGPQPGDDHDRRPAGRGARPDGAHPAGRTGAAGLPGPARHRAVRPAVRRHPPARPVGGRRRRRGRPRRAAATGAAGELRHRPGRPGARGPPRRRPRGRRARQLLPAVPARRRLPARPRPQDDQRAHRRRRRPLARPPARHVGAGGAEPGDGRGLPGVVGPDRPTGRQPDDGTDRADGRDDHRRAGPAACGDVPGARRAAPAVRHRRPRPQQLPRRAPAERAAAPGRRRRRRVVHRQRDRRRGGRFRGLPGAAGPLPGALRHPPVRASSGW